MRRGDRVTVTVFGERVPATVVQTVTSLGNVKVKLDRPIVEFVDGPDVREVVRERADVQPLVTS